MPASFDLLDSTTVSSNTTAITISSIPQTHDDLYFVWVGRGNHSYDAMRELSVRINNTNNNYHFNMGFYKSGGGGANWPGTASYSCPLGSCVPARGNYDYYPYMMGVCELWIQEYTGSSTARTVTGLFHSQSVNIPGTWNNSQVGMGGIGTKDNLTYTTGGITRVDFFNNNSSDQFRPGTKVWMYGLKKS